MRQIAKTATSRSAIVIFAALHLGACEQKAEVTAAPSAATEAQHLAQGPQEAVAVYQAFDPRAKKAAEDEYQRAMAEDGGVQDAEAHARQVQAEVAGGIAAKQRDLDTAAAEVNAAKRNAELELDQVRTNQCCAACGISKYEFLRGGSSLAQWEAHLDANDRYRKGRCPPEKLAQVQEKWAEEIDQREQARERAAAELQAATADGKLKVDEANAAAAAARKARDAKRTEAKKALDRFGK